MTENQYQSQLIKKIKRMFPGCIVMKSDSSYQQGIPDLVILYGEHWASLEVKPKASASRQPNQDYYVEQLDEMSFAAYIYPENEEEVLSALQQAFKSPRRACILKS
jgi:hypothetical protein